jgi:hypothetical protein
VSPGARDLALLDVDVGSSRAAIVPLDTVYAAGAPIIASGDKLPWFKNPIRPLTGNCLISYRVPRAGPSDPDPLRCKSWTII